MKTNKQAVVIALNNSVKEFTPEEQELRELFIMLYHEFNEKYDFDLTPREFVVSMVTSVVKPYAADEAKANLEIARICLHWTKMQARHGRYTSLLNKLGNIIGDNITWFEG